jgi:hypothetical protein
VNPTILGPGEGESLSIAGNDLVFKAAAYDAENV